MSFLPSNPLTILAMLLLPTLASLFYLLPFSTPQSLLSPTPPKLEYLYTAYVDCLQSLYETQGPAGIRKAIPIVGGNFTGPRGLSGKILDLDPQTGVFSADTRYNLQTDDGANLWLRTSGSGVPAGGLHLRVVIETGDKRWYWLNNVVAVGVLNRVAGNDTAFTLRIDVWHLAGEYTNTTFVNGTTYP